METTTTDEPTQKKHIRPIIRKTNKSVNALLSSTNTSSNNDTDIPLTTEQTPYTDETATKTSQSKKYKNVVFYDKNEEEKKEKKTDEKKEKTNKRPKVRKIPTNIDNTQQQPIPIQTTYPFLQLITDPIERSNILLVYQRIIPFDKKHPFFYGSMPINVMNESYIHLVQKKYPDTTDFKYALTPKLDGFRFLLFVDPSVGIVFITREMHLYKPILQTSINQSQILYTGLFDGEYYQNMFFIFDILYYNNNKYPLDKHDIFFIKAHHIFEQRLECMKNLFNDEHFSTLSYFIANTYTIFIYIKRYFLYDEILKCMIDYNIPNFYDAVVVLHNHMHEYINCVFKYDGLIFIPRNTKYIIGDNWKYPNNILYKWKPLQDLTIDVKFVEGKGVIIGDTLFLYACVLTQSGKIIPYTINKEKTQFIKVLNNSGFIIDFNKVYEIYCFHYDTSPENVLFDIKQERELADKSVPNTVKNIKSVLRCITGNMDINYIIPFINIDNIKNMHKDIPFDILQHIDTHILQQLIIQNNKKPIIIAPSDSVIRRFNKHHTYIDELEFRVGIYDTTTNKFHSSIAFKHYDWLKKTLETDGYPSTYCETVDFFSQTRPNIRTTYYYNNNDASYFSDTTIQKTIKKIKQDTKTTNDTLYVYGYSLRISISSEKQTKENPIVYDMSKQNKTVFYRIKKRTTFMYNSSFDIDLTEVSTSKDTSRTYYEVEIEYKKNQREKRNVPVSFEELNNVLQYVYTNLYGLSEIL
jgi:hypothetical protein